MLKKATYQDNIAAQLEEWQADIKELEAHLEEAGAEAKIEYQQVLSDLITKQKIAEQKLQAFQEAGIQDQQELKDGLDQAIKALHQSFGQIKQTMENANYKTTDNIKRERIR